MKIAVVDKSFLIAYKLVISEIECWPQETYHHISFCEH